MKRARDDSVDVAMASLAAGDRAAFDVVFRALWPRCRAFARKLLGDDTLADDAAQQALLQLFHESTRYDASKSAVSWALTLTAWQVRSARKKQARRREEGVDRDHGALAFACALASPEDHAIRAGLVQQALALVDDLAPAERESIARALDDAPSGDASSRKRRQRALDKLRSYWRTRYG